MGQAEFLCIDDGSHDDSLATLQSYARYDARFKVVHQKNCGVGPTRNLGIQRSRGVFVTFLDADDYLPGPDTIERLWSAAVEHSVPIAGGSFSEDHGTWIRKDFDGVYTKYTFASDGLMDYGDYQFDYGYHRFAYETDFLRENRLIFPPYVRFQDPPFFVRAMIAAGRFYAMKEPTYVYRWGHQKLTWDHRRTLDLVRGLCDNLVLADSHDLEDLRDLTWHRLTAEYRDRIKTRIAGGDAAVARVVLACLPLAPAEHAARESLTSMLTEAIGILGRRKTAL